MRYAPIVWMVGALAACGPSAPVAPVASTSAGQFEGTRRDGVELFLGVRYGEPPVGDLRWRPPVRAGYVAGVQKATDFGTSPPQLFDEEEPTSALPQSEDCLFLNVFTPGRSGHRPVLVFIHGGGWVNGGTADSWYYGAHLARRGDIVVVTVGYRLGPLGFLDLSGIGGPEYASSGNLGLLDQQLAMRWVHDHVADFGGDPDDVTLMGQSAGAQSVAIHMALPESRALFHRAIAESGALSLVRSQSTARATAAEFMADAGVSDIAGLRALSVQQIMDAEMQLEGSTIFSDLLYSPVLDGSFIPELPMDVIARGDAAGIPLLSGTTRDETKNWFFYYDYLALTEPRFGVMFLPFVQDLFDTNRLEALITGYETRSPTATPGDITMQLATDLLFRQAQIRLAEAQAVHQPNTFMYLFDWRIPLGDGFYGSPHGAELPLIFRAFDELTGDEYVGNPPPIALADAMEQAWVAFIKTGVPSSPLLPTWPAYDSTTRATMRIDTTSFVENDPLSGDRVDWQAVAFDSLVPAL